jgi:hypothetical protein
MFYRKSFLVCLLAFAALTLGRSQEAMGQFEWSWGDLPPGFIDGGSEVLVYHCSQGDGTNSLTVGDGLDSKSDRLDSFKSDGDVSCDFTGAVKGRGIQCHYNLEWTGDLVKCVNKGTDAVLTVRARCDDLNVNEPTSSPNLNAHKPTSSPNVNVSGTLSCPRQPTDQRETFQGAIAFLGISSIGECKQLYGNRADILFTAVTFAGQSCDKVLKSANDAGVLVSGGLSAKKVRDFVLGGLTATTTKVCHSDGGEVADCITPTGDTNRSISDLPNLGETACVAEPKIWNVDCHGSKEKDKDKDDDNGSVCYLNRQAGFFSFDPKDLDAETATLNDVTVELKKGKPLCKITDCDGDGIDDDFQCTFPTCDGDTATAGGGELTMITNFLGDTGGLTCTTTVKTSGKRS